MSRDHGKDVTEMDELEKQLRAARDVHVPDGLMGRVLQDALSVQPVPGPAAVPLWRRLRDMLGGWQGLGGLVAAGCAGFWIGVAPPTFLPDSAEFLLGAAADEDPADIIAFGWTLEDEE